MLRELHISNLAVIADARIEFAAGLNCFTGATGAGKSLVIGAIELLLGLRSGGELLRAGADEGRVSGVFELMNPELLHRIDAATDLPVSRDGGEILLVRRLFSSGRSSASLNGNPITLGMLRQIGEILVDVHGQHDNQYLLKSSNQLDVVDRYANAWDQRTRYAESWQLLQSLRDRLSALTTGESLRRQQIDLLQFQASEIDAAELDVKEFAELESRSGMLENVERLRKETTAAHAALYDADGSIVDRLKMVQAVLADLSVLDAGLRPVADLVRDGLLQLEEAAFDLSRYMDKLDLDPAELEEVNQRLNTINRVIRKYGTGVEDVLDERERIGRELGTLVGDSTDAGELQARIDALQQTLGGLARELSKVRAAAAKALSPLVEAQLADLGMEKARFAIEVSSLTEPAPSGADAVEFMVRTNPGLPSQPLRKVASGGEIGRIMLALKGVLAGGAGANAQPGASVLVFDEIDANIGGRLGAVIGAKLRDLSRHHQVLCITHLPQIAAYADRHLTVRKEQGGEKTSTTVRTITDGDRVEELAEMIGGTKITDTTRAQARELLDAAATAPAATDGKAKKRRRVAS